MHFPESHALNRNIRRGLSSDTILIESRSYFTEKKYFKFILEKKQMALPNKRGGLQPPPSVVLSVKYFCTAFYTYIKVIPSALH